MPRPTSELLTEAQTTEIRTRYAAGDVNQRDLAAEFGVSQTLISQIVRGDTRKTVAGPTLRPRQLARNQGTKNPNARLTDAQVAEIREQYARGSITQRQLAAQHRVSQKSIWAIVHNVRWNAGKPQSNSVK